jgi:RimJ/RimL family protein N-acetyltransferase
MKALFETGRFRALELRREDIAALQLFFEENPGYFLSVNGEPPRPNEAAEEFHTLPPPEVTFKGRWLIRFLDAHGAMAGMAGVLSDFMAPGVWHIGIFIVATPLHGSGAAAELNRAMEAWMASRGAQWLRLGVVQGNARAERFWEKAGYHEVRRRHGVEMGRLVNTLRVMVKPLPGATLAGYLDAVARDRPDSP